MPNDPIWIQPRCAAQVARSPQNMKAKPLPTEDASNELQLTNNPDCRIQASSSDQNGYSPLNAVEKSIEDGYNWRKYG
ncbi:hypothetical protein MA16_Dca000328 [Dendrobium catenatum]|uniref:WRKY domain-containing protein n=1 Tax=Dendrobium catenatum TaxID=906689 RepID=A0A2I0WTJ9_9ASPA|nr:hypothetical protein MA16_Dca000328 [Dendrobium catenatum]